MISYLTARAFLNFVSIMVLSCMVGCGSVQQVGGGYAAVTAADMDGISTSHRTGLNDFEFSWSFDQNGFVIEGNKLPEDLIADLTGTEEAISRIEGTWDIQGGQIHFSVNTDGKTIKSNMPIFRTGPIRIQSSAAQYVF